MSNEKIENAKDMVRESKEITGVQKDALMDVLVDAGKAANGVPEADRQKAIAKAQESMTIYMARDAEHRPADFRRILKEELPAILDKAFDTHMDKCLMNVKRWDGRDRRGTHTAEETKEDEPTVSAKSKWWSFKATGKDGMKPMIKIVAIIAVASVAIALIWKLQVVVDMLRENKAILENNQSSHAKTVALMKTVEREVEALTK